MSGLDPEKDWRQWIAIAEQDLRVARLCLREGEMAPAAYHCQQVAEKLVKALLTQVGEPFRRTHDLFELTAQARPYFPEFEQPLRILADYGVWAFLYRYPFPDQTRAVAAEDVAAALSLLEPFSTSVTELLSSRS